MGVFRFGLQMVFRGLRLAVLGCVLVNYKVLISKCDL